MTIHLSFWNSWLLLGSILDKIISPPDPTFAVFLTNCLMISFLQFSQIRPHVVDPQGFFFSCGSRLTLNVQCHKYKYILFGKSRI
jgi:hypothetical protein